MDEKEFKKQLEQHRNSIDGVQPFINYTSMSKAAKKLHYDEEATQLMDSSRSSSLSFEHNAALSNNLTGLSNQTPNITKTPTQDDSISSLNQQQGLKTLEILFNEIAMAHYSDQKTLEKCIGQYQEKYHKSDYMLNIIFENLNATLNVSFRFDLHI